MEYRTAGFCSEATHTDTERPATGASETWTDAGQWMDAAWDAEDGLAAFIGASGVDDDLVEGTALDLDTAYDVRVAAVGVLGVGAWADGTATPTTEARAPGMPRNVKVTPAPGRLTVTWDPPVDRGNPPFETWVVEIKPTNGLELQQPGLPASPGREPRTDFPTLGRPILRTRQRSHPGRLLPARGRLDTDQYQPQRLRPRRPPRPRAQLQSL